MEVTLKKGSDYARQALDAANKVRIEPTVAFGIHCQQDATAVQQAQAEKVAKQAAEQRAFLRANYAIREAIGRKNAETGISSLLTERAEIEALEKKLGTLLSHFEAAIGAGIDPATIPARIAAHNSRAESSRFYDGDKSFTLSAVTEEQAEAIRDELAAFKRRKAEIQDKVAGINLNTKISLSPETVAALKAAKIVA